MRLYGARLGEEGETQLCVSTGLLKSILSIVSVAMPFAGIFANIFPKGIQLFGIPYYPIVKAALPPEINTSFIGI